MFNWIKSLFNKNSFKIQTFTYYIPAPPPRDKGYREKQFDKVFFEFINRGYEIVDFKTQTHSGSDHQGMWAIFVVRATNSKAEELDLDFDSIFSNNSLELDHTDHGDKIEGLYHIKD
ncbi:MAG: hypothetical protein GY909_12890 [Oligoflexia bacterium]|nr:hypothetical protein [Oligoflexia bacterium]